MQHNKMNFILLTIKFLITQMQHDKTSQLFFFPKIYFQIQLQSYNIIQNQ